MYGLLRDAEQVCDLLPAPAELACTTNLKLLDRFQKRSQRRDSTQSDLGISAPRLRHDFARLNHLVKLP